MHESFTKENIRARHYLRVFDAKCANPLALPFLIENVFVLCSNPSQGTVVMRAGRPTVDCGSKLPLITKQLGG